MNLFDFMGEHPCLTAGLTMVACFMTIILLCVLESMWIEWCETRRAGNDRQKNEQD